MGPVKERTEGLRARWQKNRPRFAAAGTAWGFAATILFALYNGGLGIWYVSLWHGSIGAYYILLSLLRGILLAAERNAKRMKQDSAESYRKGAFTATAWIAPVMNAALVTPVSLMVLDQRPIRTGLIPAIASAAYTTYKISAAAVGMRRTGTALEQELRMLRFVDALVSVLVLQNTLIIAVDGGIPLRLFRLVAVSSAGILLLIFGISGVWLVRSLLLYRKRS